MKVTRPAYNAIHIAEWYVDDAPAGGLLPGVLVHQSERAWRIDAAMQFADGHAWLRLSIDDVKRYGEPTVGESLEL